MSPRYIEFDEESPSMVVVDLSSIESVVFLTYRSASFKPGGHPDWETDRLVSAPDVRLFRNSESGRESFDLEGYIRNIESMISAGRLPSFHEKEIAATVHEFGDIGHSFSTYEARTSEHFSEVLFRGINSISVDAERRSVANRVHDLAPGRPIDASPAAPPPLICAF